MTRTFPEPDPAVAYLEQVRQARGVSWAKLAADSGLSYNTWRTCVDGRRSPSIATLRAVAAALDHTLAVQPRNPPQAPTGPTEDKPR